MENIKMVKRVIKIIDKLKISNLFDLFIKIGGDDSITTEERNAIFDFVENHSFLFAELFGDDDFLVYNQAKNAEFDAMRRKEAAAIERAEFIKKGIDA